MRPEAGERSVGNRDEAGKARGVRGRTGPAQMQRALFGVATFGNAAPLTITAQLQLYFTKYLSYDPVILANVRFVSTFFDAVTDPLMGYISDRTRTRFGRRMPYIAVGALVYAAGIIGMFLAPAGMTTAQFYAYLITVQILFSIGVTMTGVPYTALIPEVAKEYSVRTTLASWMQAGAYLGNIWGGGCAGLLHVAR